MVKKTLIIISLCLIHSCGLYAQSVSQEMATRVAEDGTIYQSKILIQK